MMRGPEPVIAAGVLALILAACEARPMAPPSPEEPAEETPAPEEPASEEPDAEEPEGDDEDFLADREGRVFSYLPVGDLLPESGPGNVDATVYQPDILFPLEDAAFLNSQVYRHGGGKGSVNGMEGGQCAPSNYDYPWQDTFCESRSRRQIMCPNGGHEGVDLRAATCIPESGVSHWAVAVDDGRIVGLAESKYTVKLQTADGALYRYLHLKMDELAVRDGETVVKGQRIGKVWNDFFNASGERAPTTYHLHFEMYQNYAPDETTDPVFDQVNPYMTLVNAYEKKLRGEE